MSKEILLIDWSSVADPNHVDPDPDPAFVTLLRILIWIRILASK
jgi:hypothetical protein